jgi:hypothetical protein
MLSASEVESLLSKLCVDLGFCLPPSAQEQLKENPPTDAKGFTDAVFIAEGLDPFAANRHLYRQVKSMVADAFRKNEEARDPSM